MKLPVMYDNLEWHHRRDVRNEYIRLQENKCWYCKSDLTQEPPSDILSKQINWNRFPGGFMNNPIHLQHDHKTGLTEGAVHAYCNAVLWQYEGR